MLEDNLYSEFVLLYRLLHRTRFPRANDDAHECLVEKYYQNGIDDGGRVREHLHEGMEAAIRKLGSALLAHSASEELRAAFQSGRLDAADKIDRLSENEPFETRVFRIHASNLDLAPKVYRKEFHFPKFFPVFFHPRLLDVVEGDVVYAVMRPWQVTAVAMAVLNAGKRVFIETPPGRSSAGAERIAEAASGNHRLVCLGLRRREAAHFLACIRESRHCPISVHDPTPSMGLCDGIGRLDPLSRPRSY